jgi:hypothetical protein
MMMNFFGGVTEGGQWCEQVPIIITAVPLITE